MYDTLCTIAAENNDFSSVFTRERPIRKRCFLVIAGDRGLAGGSNTNVFRTVRETCGDEPYCVVPVGKKAVEYYKKIGVEILTEDFAAVGTMDLYDCSRLGRFLAQGYRDGQFDALHLAYTDFHSMLLQTPACIALLPLQVDEKHEIQRGFVLYEPSASAVFDRIIPEYLSGMAYGGVCESYASELAARRTAMDSATKNASDMIDALSLQYNRARQSAITQEITEIVAGSEGLS